MMQSSKSPDIQLHPIGRVSVDAAQGVFCLKVDEPFRNGLLHLDYFSHAHIVWWAHEHDNPKSRNNLVTKLPYAPGVKAGVFACRSEYRPNPIAMTICPVLGVDIESGVVHLAYIDAFDGSPLLDIKPYIPVSDRIREVKVAEWFSEWPGWYEDAAGFFSEDD